MAAVGGGRSEQCGGIALRSLLKKTFCNLLFYLRTPSAACGGLGCSIGLLLAQTHGEAVDTDKLIPHMRKFFMPKDPH